MSPDVIDAIIIDPETERHVRIEFKVENSATRHVGVSVVTAIGELNINLTTKKVGSDVINSVGITEVKFHDL